MSFQLDLSQQLDMLPAQPGVYLMRDAADTILYIGKARNLARRVSSYFQNRPLNPMAKHRQATSVPGRVFSCV
ncbi:MAG: hypothetical protein CVV27_17720 [Candidatus Melainabacteria bacterium HGW-Melainabacteria-1]|nr:MAG: hypothetical protein CVV27_17720 [Candidatus Melainabacteria bacterium HGW-Melainabacteria-1]